ncbi:Hypothetical predicted protein [Paramuricea clavata]|uniref:Uncharacterized protein n=1 Tax=Paramuricea clavata TaxID=317549 RepID=A0A7D9HIB3_PARCT|nr:Hypothetical predicted protein [Paramuricea clavata]
MKQPLNQLPPLPRDLLLCAATNSGYPENEYDISVSHSEPFLYLLKSFAPYPPGVTVHQYPILTPLSPNRRRPLGGNITICMDEPEEVVSMKVYNLVFHLLRACHPEPLSSSVTTRQGSALFDTLNSIMNVLSVNHHLVGGIRLGVRVQMNHVSDAVDHVLERQLFNPHQFGVNCRYNKVPVRRYIQYAEGLFRTARALLSRSGVIRHDAGREMSNLEKRVFGDLKLLLGYRFAGYRTVPGRENPWWLQRVPAIQQRQNPPPNPPPPPPPCAQQPPPANTGEHRRHSNRPGSSAQEACRTKKDQLDRCTQILFHSFS